jgi:hypothetical protein
MLVFAPFAPFGGYKKIKLLYWLGEYVGLLSRLGPGMT